MRLVKEFREFALKGNVLDLAVGVVIGAAFGAIVTSLIADIIMPLAGMAGNADFSNLYIGLNEKAKAAIAAAEAAGHPLGLADARKAGPVLAYGQFITVVINFLIVAFCVFLVIKLANKARRRFEAEKPAPAPPGPTMDQQLLMEIRDLLKK